MIEINEKAINNNSIFILDDDKDILKTTKDLFDSLNISYFLTDNVSEGLDTLSKYRKHINYALIDNKLKQSNGIEFIKKARENYPNIKFSILTGYDLSISEMNEIIDLNVRVYDKSSFSLDNYIKKYLLKSLLSDDDLVTSIKLDSISDAKQEIFKNNIELAKLKNDLKNIKITSTDQAITQLKNLTASLINEKETRLELEDKYNDIKREFANSYLKDINRITKYYRWAGLSVTITLTIFFILLLIHGYVSGTYTLLGIGAFIESVLFLLAREIFKRIDKYEDRMKEMLFQIMEFK